MLRANRADRLTIVAIVVVPVPVVRVEVEVPRVVRVVLVEGRRPVVAVRADIVGVRVVAIARRGEALSGSCLILVQEGIIEEAELH